MKKNEVYKIMICNICEGKKYLFFKYRDFFDKSVSIYKCINCGHGSHNAYYSPDAFSSIYGEAYSTEYIESSNELFLKRQLQYKIDVGCLTKFFIPNRPIKVLDYGCSSGNFLDTMPADWAKVGYELNKSHIEHIKLNKPHIKICDDLSKVEGKFDLVTMRGVIEHIQDHNEILGFLSKKITQGGGLFISATPDFSSFPAIFYREEWNQIICPEHLHQFTSASLSYLLSKAGLVLKYLEHPYYETPYSDWNNDKINYLKNTKNIRAQKKLANTRHAFPGNIMTAFFEKVE